MKRIVLIFILLLSALPLFSEEHDDNYLYFTTNPFGYLHFMGNPDIDMVVPVLTSAEYGVNLSANVILDSSHGLELRFSSGPASKIAINSQLQIGYKIFILEMMEIQNKGLYGGLFLKGSDQYYKFTDIHFFNILPQIAAGYLINPGKFIFDIRLNQSLCFYSFSSDPNISSGSAPFFSAYSFISPVLPSLSINAGFRL